MKPSEFKQLIKAIRQCDSKRAVMVESSPGLGKTQIVAQVAAELGIGFKAIHAPLLQPEDYGMPVVHGAKKDQLKFIVSAEKFPLENSDCPEQGIFLIDELPQADQSAQKILANLVQERDIHGHKLKKGWTIIATGNRASDRAGANRILGHLSNRMTRVELDASLDDWSQWALENGVKPEVVAFIRFRPELLTNYDSKQEINATPRAWVEGISARLGVIPSSLEFNVFSGDVGQGPASELLAFLKIFRQLPNPDAIMLDPKKSAIPKDAATIYAIVGALVSRVTPANFGRALTYIKRLPPEFSVLFVKDCMAKDSDIANTTDFIDWASKDGADLLT
jgi:hypothetical protein